MTLSTPAEPGVDRPSLVPQGRPSAGEHDALAPAAEQDGLPSAGEQDALASATAFPPTGDTGPSRRTAVGRILRVGEVQLDPHRNGLNLVRLGLALGVLVSHGWALSGGVERRPGGETIGTWSVFGFFALSGYLITGSRLSSPLTAYLLRRVARIFPAYLVCLVVMVLGFAPLAYWKVHGTIEGFLTTPTTPLTHLANNVALRLVSYDIAGTPTAVPYPGVWNGSLWSLYLEFWCYVVIALVFSIAALRRRATTTLIVGLALSVVATAAMPTLDSYVMGSTELPLFAWLLPFFLAGGLVRTLQRYLVLTWPGAVVSMLGIGVVASANLDAGPHMVAPLVVYLLLWLGAVVPCPAWVRRNDISYGAYIYAFPVQQILLTFGATAWPLIAFDGVAAIVTAVLAAASWFLVERPVMDRVRRATRRPDPAAASAAA